MLKLQTEVSSDPERYTPINNLYSFNILNANKDFSDAT